MCYIGCMPVRPGLAALIGQPADRADTPVPLLDLDAFERNARAISGFLAGHGVAWRPHVKAHKSPQLAKLQLKHGAAGVTCAKVGEAEVMVAAGIGHVLVANHLATPLKWQRAAALQATAEVIVCVDSVDHVRLAAAAAADAGTQLPLLIEVDVGMARTGVRSSGDALALAAAIAREPGLRLAGVMGYEGHLLKVWPAEEKRARCAAALGTLTSVAADLRAAGHEIAIVSSGGTGSFQATAALPGLTEIQAGGGCLMDRFYAEDCHVNLEPALSLLTTVVSTEAAGRAIVDAGFKACGALAGFALPLVLGDAGLSVRGLSAEHGILDAAGPPPPVGTPVRLIPGYSDAMLVLHDFLIGYRSGTITDIIAMPARGQLT
jgi:D-serine deaminase-like pyridoxal phosphate-dependent protein